MQLKYTNHLNNKDKDTLSITVCTLFILVHRHFLLSCTTPNEKYSTNMHFIPSDYFHSLFHIISYIVFGQINCDFAFLKILLPVFHNPESWRENILVFFASWLVWYHYFDTWQSHLSFRLNMGSSVFTSLVLVVTSSLTLCLAYVHIQHQPETDCNLMITILNAKFILAC